ncbi:MAG: ABC transporter substrate-binding protein, partial [Candidatus Hodarchaeota archaeon]
DCYEYFGSNTIIQLTHGLFELNMNVQEPVPGPILEDYSISADGITYNFSLKDGIKFSDGTDFNATAMKWILDRTMAINGDPAWLIGDVIDTVTVVNETYLSIDLLTADNTFIPRLTYTTAWPMSPASLPVDSVAGDPTQPGAGLGAYKIKSWTKDVELILEHNPYYFGPTPVNTEVIIKFYTSSSTMLAALEAGDIDIIQRDLGPEERKDVIANAGLRYVTEPTDGIRYLLFNVQMETDVNIRRAVAAAIHRGQITSTVFSNFVDPIFTMVHPAYPGSIDVFPNGPIQSYVVGNMTLAGYCISPTVTATQTNTQTATQTATQTQVSTTTITAPGFEFLSVFALLVTFSTVLALKKKKQKHEN